VPHRVVVYDYEVVVLSRTVANGKAELLDLIAMALDLTGAMAVYSSHGGGVYERPAADPCVGPCG
jgi:hypothetical protein